MGNVYGDQIRLSIFGESHGEGVGIVLSGLEEGLVLDQVSLAREIKRRSTAQSLASGRKEKDQVHFYSGILNGKTLPSPIMAMVLNTGAKSSDYDAIQGFMRPSHADYPAFVKYRNQADMRGGGHFSGRLTLGLVVAGVLCRMGLLSHEPFAKSYGVGSHILQLYSYKEPEWTKVTKAQLLEANGQFLPSEDPGKLKKLIAAAKARKDSLGGIVETVALGIPAGLGEPFFESLESKLSQLLFSIPGVKGVSFGIGDRFSSLLGSEANDAYTLTRGRIRTKTNHNGGILGGITTGMPLVFKTVIKPTPSIGIPQESVDITEMKRTKKAIGGHHDPCILPRAIPVIEACVHVAVYDAYLSQLKRDHRSR